MELSNNVEIARRMFQAHHDGDLEGFLAPLADDVHYEYMTEHPQIGGVRNKQQWRETLEWGMQQTDGGIRMDVSAIFGSGNLVCVEAVALGKQAGSDEPYTNKCCFVLRFKDGVIVEGHQYNDTWHVAQIIHKETQS